MFVRAAPVVSVTEESDVQKANIEVVDTVPVIESEIVASDAHD